MNSIEITRRTALGLIAATVTGSQLLWPRSSFAQGARPRLHLTPPYGFINDPQRPLWSNGVWNLWVLWNGDYPNGGGTAWRHYTSADLLTWSDQGISIAKYAVAQGDVWTGSSIIDWSNIAGLGHGTVIAIMTMPNDTNGVQCQSSGRWYSTDGGNTFTFDQIVQENPNCGNSSVTDKIFRDPNIFWDGGWNNGQGRWFISLAEIGKIGFYTSDNFKTWTYRDCMFQSSIGVMECPNLFPLHLYDEDGSINGDKWVLLCGGSGSSVGFTGGTYYWVGSFDGTKFVPDSGSGQWLDGGSDFYAATAFTDANASDPLAYVLAIAWQNNWDYAQSMPNNGYYGQLTLTRQLRLQMVNGTPILFNTPLAWQNNVLPTLVSGTDQVISDAAAYAWPAWSNDYSCRIDFTISTVDGSWQGAAYISVRGGDGFFTQVGFEPGSNNAFLKRYLGGPAPKNDSAWNDQRNVPCDFSAPVHVSIFVDAYSIEVFLNGGRISISGLITAPLNATGLNLTTSAGSALISNLSIRTA